MKKAPLHTAMVMMLGVSTIAHAQGSTTVRGRLDVVTEAGRAYPGQGMRVNLRAIREEKRSLPVYAGSDGMFYLNNVPKGKDYLLEIGSREPAAIWTCALTVPPSTSSQAFDLAPVRLRAVAAQYGIRQQAQAQAKTQAKAQVTASANSRQYDGDQVRDGTSQRIRVDSVTAAQVGRVPRCARYSR